jgi:hypothetical protein
MTLVIAGFEKEKDAWADAWPMDKVELDEWSPEDIPEIAEKTAEPAEDRPIKLTTNGLFAVADSLITTPGVRNPKPLLAGLRKIHPIPVTVWKPYIVNGLFRDYLEIESGLSTTCFVAFAGSTLTASHAMNSITEHLSSLRITHVYPNGPHNAARYAVRKNCEYLDIRDAKGYIEIADDMYLPNDFEGILSAQNIADVIEHSINTAFESGKKYRLDEISFRQMGTDFVAGIECPATKQYRLFAYRIKSRTNVDGLLEVYTKQEEIFDNEVVVLGMTKEFNQRAQDAYQEALKQGKSTGKALFEFLNTAIDEVAETDDVLIDRPAVLKILKDRTLKKTAFKSQPKEPIHGDV